MASSVSSRTAARSLASTSLPSTSVTSGSGSACPSGRSAHGLGGARDRRLRRALHATPAAVESLSAPFHCRSDRCTSSHRVRICLMVRAAVDQLRRLRVLLRTACHEHVPTRRIAEPPRSLGCLAMAVRHRRRVRSRRVRWEQVRELRCDGEGQCLARHEHVAVARPDFLVRPLVVSRRVRLDLAREVPRVLLEQGRERRQRPDAGWRRRGSRRAARRRG